MISTQLTIGWMLAAFIWGINAGMRLMILGQAKGWLKCHCPSSCECKSRAKAGQNSTTIGR